MYSRSMSLNVPASKVLKTSLSNVPHLWLLACSPRHPILAELSWACWRPAGVGASRHWYRRALGSCGSAESTGTASAAGGISRRSLRTWRVPLETWSIHLCRHDNRIVTVIISYSTSLTCFTSKHCILILLQAQQLRMCFDAGQSTQPVKILLSTSHQEFYFGECGLSYSSSGKWTEGLVWFIVV